MEKRVGVEGMMCQHCVKHVHDALSALHGVESVDVSLEGKSAKVTCSTEVTDDDICKAISEAGYEVTGIEG